MVWLACVAAPCRTTLWVTDVALSELSVSATVPVRVPLAVGAKATAMEHCPEEDSCVVELQSLAPDGTCVKFVVIVRFDTVNSWFPALETVRPCEVLVEPMLVLAKTSAAACVQLILITLPESVT